MIGRDGRVRVMDFGLARPLRELVPATTSAAGSSPAYPTTSTTIGAFIGTPAYVAPEQLAGGSVDVRADQFSFCVALHEALYGERPGTPARTPEMTAARGAPSRKVPPWLRAIVRRGLEPDREKRFESMPALLRAIERGRTRTRSRLVAVAATTLALVASLGAWRASAGRRFACVPPSDRDRHRVASERDTRVAPCVAASALPGERPRRAREDLVTFDRILDGHMTEWTDMYRDACEATHVRREQSVEVLDLRMTCLSQNLDEVHAYTDALAAADKDALGRAIATADSLSLVRQCSDIKNLRLQVPLPTRSQSACRRTRAAKDQARGRADRVQVRGRGPTHSCSRWWQRRE